MGATLFDGSSGHATGWVSRLDWSGRPVWQRGFAGLSQRGLDVDLRIGSLSATSDGGVVVTAFSGWTAGVALDWIGEWDAAGNLLWQNEYQSDLMTTIWGAEAQRPLLLETQDGGYLLSSLRYTAAGDNNHVILRLDDDGDLVWQRMLVDPNSSALWSAFLPLRMSLVGTEDMYVASEMIVNGTYDTVVARISGQGEILWQQIIRPLGEVYDICTASDGGFLVAVGTTGLVKLNAAGVLEWGVWVASGSLPNEFPIAIAPDSVGGAFIGGGGFYPHF